MPNIETAVAWAETIAKDDSHGYSQYHRTGPDYDCSSFIGEALEQGGFSGFTGGETTRNLREKLLNAGFQIIDVFAPRQRGDIFLTEDAHVVMCVDANNIVHASIDENGGIAGNMPGDQTGKEICIRSYYNRPWQYHFRYMKASTQVSTNSPKYTIGTVYTLQANMCVRVAPGVNSRLKSHSELTEDGRAHDTDKNGCLEAGTRVSCQELTNIGNDIWMRIPSGYIAAYYNGNIYVR